MTPGSSTSAPITTPPRSPRNRSAAGGRPSARTSYPGAARLLVTCDAGGSNGYRARAWKAELAQARGRDRAGDHGVPLPARHQQVEQDRAPAVLPHHPHLAGPPADQLRGRGEHDRRDRHQHRADRHRRPGRRPLPDRDRGQPTRRRKTSRTGSSPGTASTATGTTPSSRTPARPRTPGPAPAPAPPPPRPAPDLAALDQPALTGLPPGGAAALAAVLAEARTPPAAQPGGTRTASGRPRSAPTNPATTPGRRSPSPATSWPPSSTSGSPCPPARSPPCSAATAPPSATNCPAPASSWPPPPPPSRPGPSPWPPTRTCATTPPPPAGVGAHNPPSAEGLAGAAVKDEASGCGGEGPQRHRLPRSAGGRTRSAGPRSSQLRHGRPPAGGCQTRSGRGPLWVSERLSPAQ